MNEKAYVLLYTRDRSSRQVAEILKEKPGVVTAEAVDGNPDSPDVVLVLEAGERRELASLMLQALSSVENMTEDLCLLPRSG